jgi:hypothetical protein
MVLMQFAVLLSLKKKTVLDGPVVIKSWFYATVRCRLCHLHQATVEGDQNQKMGCRPSQKQNNAKKQVPSP